MNPARRMETFSNNSQKNRTDQITLKGGPFYW